MTFRRARTTAHRLPLRAIARKGMSVQDATDPRFVVLRHAESEGNAAGIVQGAGEYPLSRRGVTAARSSASRASRLAPVLVASSQLARANHTALLLFGRCDVTDLRLQERMAGDWEGTSRTVLEHLHQGALENDALRPAGFEPEHEVWERTLSALHDLDLSAPAGVIAVVSHGALLRVLDRRLGGDGSRFSHLQGLVLSTELSSLGRLSLTPPDL
jgi:broad specificity phosphatase PhoE